MPTDERWDASTAPITDTKEPMPFRWRVTKLPEGKLVAEVGDEFTFKMGTTPAQVQLAFGIDVMLAGAKLLGLTHDEAKSLALLAYGMLGHASEEAEDDD